MESIDETLKLLAHASELAARIKAREEELARDRGHLDYVLRRLSTIREAGAEGAQGAFRADVRAMPQQSSDLGGARVGGLSVTVVPHTNVTPRLQSSEPTEEVSKYDLIFQLIASGRFDIGMAARALYNEDSERARNRVRAGVNHLRERNLVVRNPDGTYTAIRRKPIPGAIASAAKREG